MSALRTATEFDSFPCHSRINRHTPTFDSSPSTRTAPGWFIGKACVSSGDKSMSLGYEAAPNSHTGSSHAMFPPHDGDRPPHPGPLPRGGEGKQGALSHKGRGS